MVGEKGITPVLAADGGSGHLTFLDAVGVADLVRAVPGLAKPHNLVQAARQCSALETLLLQLVLQEEIKRSGGQSTSLAIWRLERWGARVEQAFIDQRRRFERASYYQLMLPERGEAMELCYQLCNAEVTFDALLQRYLPTKPGKRQRGLVREQPLQGMPQLLAKKLRKSRPGVPLTPLALGRGWVLLQLIELHAPVLDQATRELLEQEVEAQWLLEELHRRLTPQSPLSDAAALASLPA